MIKLFDAIMNNDNNKYLEDCKVIIVDYLETSKTANTFACYNLEADITMVYSKEYFDKNTRGLNVGGISDIGFSFGFDLSENFEFLYIEALFVKALSCKKKDLILPEYSINARVVLSRSSCHYYERVKYVINPDNNILYITLIDNISSRKIGVGNNIIFEIDDTNQLTGIWIYGIVEDLDFSRMKKWRKELKNNK